MQMQIIADVSFEYFSFYLKREECQACRAYVLLASQSNK